MDAARKFVDKGQIDKAVKEYLRIVHEDPKDVRVWLKIGDLYAKKGSKQDAIETYLKVARFYHDQGFFLKAVAVYKQILKLDPRLVDVILKLAELYRQLGLMSDAMQHFESVAAHFHREGNTKEALATVKKLVDLDPENIATRIKLAELYSKEGLVEEAATEFAVACEQLRRQGRQDDFVKVAERLLWHKPNNHALNRELAGLYLRRNDPRRALQKLQACFKADPRDVETLGLLAQAFQALEQKAKTVSVLKELARVHVENKQRDNAGEVYRKILEFVPSDADALQFLGPGAAPAPTPSPRLAPLVARPSAGASAGDAQFGLTADLPALPAAVTTMTGSMPLVDEQDLSGVDFALPDYDDGDFSADMEPADPRQLSAAGEEHADEIAKILAETDVYVKYGLHQKAADHLRRVFGLDPENLEAHERLKDILLAQGRVREAESTLLKLAELIAPADPDRAEAYLQELLAMNGQHTGAFELARRFRLRVSRMSSVSSEVEYQMATAGGVELELDELDLLSGPARSGRASRDSVDDFDPDEIISGDRVANGSPATRLPQRPAYEIGGESFDLDFEPSPSQSTRPLLADDVDALSRMTEEVGDLGDLGQVVEGAGGGELEGLEGLEGLDDAPFDRDAARAFDRAVAARTPVPARGPSPTPTPVSEPAFDELADPLGVHGSYDPYSGEALRSSPFDPTAAHGVAPDEIGDGLAEGPGDEVVDAPRAESHVGVEDDLDEADFYAGQGMYAEALDIVRGLLARYPHHRLIQTKLREIESMARGESPIGDAIDSESAVSGGGTDAIDLDAIEEMPIEDLEELPASAPVKKRRPTVMLENPVDEGDAETHYDLGLAYKEMGLHDEAIKAFEKVLRSPQREVQCRLMIGMCQRDMGNPSEAIHQFKQGLHAEPSERERQSLYYEIGVTYEAIGDSSEALYYYEMVTKRDPGFADAATRAANLRARGMPSEPEDL
jgi:tetratricopeptide (TPR) repeat protein